MKTGQLAEFPKRRPRVEIQAAAQAGILGVSAVLNDAQRHPI